MSGYAQSDSHRQGLSLGMPFLHKPFTADALARIVRGALDASRTPA